jgi:hypothetical protein
VVTEIRLIRAVRYNNDGRFGSIHLTVNACIALASTDDEVRFFHSPPFESSNTVLDPPFEERLSDIPEPLSLYVVTRENDGGF